MIQGKASIVGGKELEQNELLLLEKVHKLLSRKYFQYQEIGIEKYIIMMVPFRMERYSILTVWPEARSI